MKIEKWKHWLGIIRGEITQMLINSDIFWNVQTIIKNNNDLHKPNSLYNYLGDTYISYITIGIRRQVKIKEKSISFAGLLKDISENPLCLKRKYFVNLYKDSVTPLKIADEDFDMYCGSDRNYISKEKVNNDLIELRQAAHIVEDFTDRRIAHRDKSNPKVLPRFNQVDSCLDTFDRLCCKYDSILNAVGRSSLMPTYQYDWKQIFTVPWLKYDEEKY